MAEFISHLRNFQIRQAWLQVWNIQFAIVVPNTAGKLCTDFPQACDGFDNRNNPRICVYFACIREQLVDGQIMFVRFWRTPVRFKLSSRDPSESAFSRFWKQALLTESCRRPVVIFPTMSNANLASD